MKNIVKKFIENYQAPEDLSFLLKHYLKDSDENLNTLVENFIYENLLFDIEDLTKENIEKVSNFESYIDFYDGAVNTYNEDLIKNIELFWDFIENFWNKDNFYENLINWQKIAYEKILVDIKEKFVFFLKEQLD